MVGELIALVILPDRCDLIANRKALNASRATFRDRKGLVKNYIGQRLRLRRMRFLR